MFIFRPLCLYTNIRIDNTNQFLICRVNLLALNVDKQWMNSFGVWEWVDEVVITQVNWVEENNNVYQLLVVLLTRKLFDN